MIFIIIIFIIILIEFLEFNNSEKRLSINIDFHFYNKISNYRMALNSIQEITG